MVFVETGPVNIRRQLLDTTEAWRKARVAGSCTSSLRQTLLGVVWMELGARLKRAETEQPTMHAMLKSGLATMTANQPQWKYVTWSPEKGTHNPALEKKPLSQQNALEAVRMLKLMPTKSGAVQRFHALGKMTAEASSGATAFMLTLSLDFQERHACITALTALTDNAATRLTGARIRPERSHRPLPQDLQTAMALKRSGQ